MDYNYSSIPLGLAMGNFLGDNARMGGRDLTEAEKEDLIFRYKDAQMKAGADSADGAVSQDEIISDLLNGPSIG